MAQGVWHTASYESTPVTSVQALVRQRSAMPSEATKSRPPWRREGGAAARVGALQAFVDELSVGEPVAGVGGGSGGGAAAESNGGPADTARLAAEVERLTAELATRGEMWRDETERLNAELLQRSSWHEDRAGAVEVERLTVELAAERAARAEAEARAASAAQLLTQVAYD